MSQNKLAGKLVKILGALGAVEKKGYNAHQKYHYMREVDVMEALKAQLIAEKIIMLTSSEFVDIQRKENKDKVEFVTTVKTIHTFIDAETNEQLSINSVGSGYDSSDKGASKAITAAVKYAIMKTFMISDEGADIENDGKTVQAPVAAPQTFKAPAVTAAPVAKTEAKPSPVAEELQAPKVTTPAPKTTAKSFGAAPVVAPTVAPAGPALGKRKAAATEPNFP
jgi:hypothetical protein